MSFLVLSVRNEMMVYQILDALVVSLGRLKGWLGLSKSFFYAQRNQMLNNYVILVKSVWVHVVCCLVRSVRTEYKVCIESIGYF